MFIIFQKDETKDKKLKVASNKVIHFVPYFTGSKIFILVTKTSMVKRLSLLKYFSLNTYFNMFGKFLRKTQFGPTQLCFLLTLLCQMVGV